MTGTIDPTRLATLLQARARLATGTGALTATALAAALTRYAPTALPAAAWRTQLDDALAALRDGGRLDAGNRPIGDVGDVADPLAAAKSWRQATDRALPALGLALTPFDRATVGLISRDHWAAAIVARTLGLWQAGNPPSPTAVYDAIAWRELGLTTKPQRCPTELRAHFLHRLLGADAGPPDRSLRQLAALRVGAPRPDLRALHDALTRRWLTNRELTGHRDLLADLRALFPKADPRGKFGDRKWFISAAWEAARANGWSELPLDAFKHALVAGHRSGAIVLARADLVAAMDPALVAASEVADRNSTYNFIVQEPS
jgi:hypothetical protein